MLRGQSIITLSSSWLLRILSCMRDLVCLSLIGGNYCILSTRNLHVNLAYNILMLKHLGGGQLPGLRNFIHLVVSQANYHVFRLEIGMDNLAHSMHVIEADQTLTSQLSYQGKRHTFIIVALDNFEEINS